MYVFASVGDNTGAEAAVGPSNALYVDVAGDDDTAARGNAARPFATVAAALAAAFTGDEILIGPGNFVNAAALSVAGGNTSVTIRGSGIQTTFIRPAAGISGFDWSTVGLLSASVFDLAIVCSGVGKAMIGTGTAAGFMSTGLICERVSMTVGAAATLAIDFDIFGEAYFLDCVIPQGSMSFVLVSRVTFRGTLALGTTTLFSWDDDAAITPTAGQMLVEVLEASKLESVVTLTGQPRFRVDASSDVTDLTGASLTVAVSTATPEINFQGTVDTIDFVGGVAVLPDSAAGAYTIDFSGCTVTGAFARFETVGTALAVDMTGFKSTGAAFALTADLLINITALGAAIRTTAVTTMYATPDVSGSITPPYLKGLIDVSAGLAAAPKTWADLGYTALVRVGTAVFDAQIQSSAQAADAVVTAKAVTGPTLTATAAVGNIANVQITF